MTAMEQRYDIASLHAAYGAGLTTADMIGAVFRRIAEANDPGIFIHLAREAELIVEAELLGPFDPVA